MTVRDGQLEEMGWSWTAWTVAAAVEEEAKAAMQPRHTQGVSDSKTLAAI